MLVADNRILIIAAAEHIGPLAQADGLGKVRGLHLETLDRDAPVSDMLLKSAALVFIEVDPANAASMHRVSDIRARMPGLPLVAAINGASVSLVRTLVKEGISDVVSLPFDIHEILQVALDTAARQEAATGQSSRLAPMVSVARSIGGCGATSIATQLAAYLATQDASGRGAVIADLDLQYGSVADFLGVTARGTLADLLHAEGRLDEELIASVLGRANGGLSVISAPETIMPLESVDSDQLLKVIRMLRQDFGYVVLDFPPDWTNWALSAALASDVILLVVELSVASLRQAKRRIELFRSIGVESDAIQIVVNRVEKRLFRTIDLNDVSETLGHRTLGSVALDAPLVSTAQNQGALVSDIRAKSRFCKDIEKIGDMLRTGRLAKGN
ncbi:AAA family ATPase [Sphingobium estronivorans]|uniref:AAA family ATPase n=1 Tax=Sphingobium estronivorans TaxID=1577690 RepID=UPI001F0737A7|nr:AAA family ATPase [Sphingobium estronivorans]